MLAGVDICDLQYKGDGSVSDWDRLTGRGQWCVSSPGSLGLACGREVISWM